jgi:hypothetical protein
MPWITLSQRHFGETYRLHFQGRKTLATVQQETYWLLLADHLCALKLEAVRLSERREHFPGTTLRKVKLSLDLIT